MVIVVHLLPCTSYWPQQLKTPQVGAGHIIMWYRFSVIVVGVLLPVLSALLPTLFGKGPLTCTQPPPPLTINTHTKAHSYLQYIPVTAARGETRAKGDTRSDPHALSLPLADSGRTRGTVLGRVTGGLSLSTEPAKQEKQKYENRDDCQHSRKQIKTHKRLNIIAF